MPTEPMQIEIARLADTQAAFQYGPEEPTKLKVTAFDVRGRPVELILARDSLVGLSRLLRQIEGTFPAALAGH